MWWTLEALGVVNEDQGVKEDDRRWWGDYVLIEPLERVADAVLEMQKTTPSIGPGGSLYTLDGFQRDFCKVLGNNQKRMTSGDAKVLLRYLERDRNAVVVDREVRSRSPDATQMQT